MKITLLGFLALSLTLGCVYTSDQDKGTYWCPEFTQEEIKFYEENMPDFLENCKK